MSSRLADTIISGAYAQPQSEAGLPRPMVDLTYGGQFAWSPNLAEYYSNASHVSRPLHCIVLDPPRLFSYLPESDKWISAFKALFETHPKVIEGFNAGLKVDTDDVSVGGAGEIQQEPTNVTRERSQPKFTWVEKYGRPIQTFLEYWIRYGIMDPETKFALMGTLGRTDINDHLPDWYSATMIFIVPDGIHKNVDKAWLTTGMFPLSGGDITAKRDLTSAQEVLTHDIEFSGVSQFGAGVNAFAQSILDSIVTLNADPQAYPATTSEISADLQTLDTVGYESWVKTVGANSVTSMGG